ncbi:PREDICTED: uncharacterized protein LOC106337789 [Brassica oleracea var. oleracea]|uniref:uncharacterized protein LOC106337789 n=1 Tax=Brassica oleracea var. oleracea TaxID=109376 RepID=UPI0006A6F741|nr:PREDICTED: uncharacterized protein LOC106337789 [Brassica oleracea var. oleracea]
MAFITDRGTYCYKVMPFGLKNAGATYQRLVNKMFAERLGVTMEVYIHDMLVKSKMAADHIDHLKDCFLVLNKYDMKLNPTKCTFGVTPGEFLGYTVTQRGIEANPKQISTILDLPSPREVQRLTGRIDALNWFISRSTISASLSTTCCWAIRNLFGTSVVKKHSNSSNTTLLRHSFWQNLRKLPNGIWILHVDGSSSSRGSEIGFHLQSPTGELLQQSFRLGFKASNNEAEYESLIAGLHLAQAVQAKCIQAYCDCQLVANQFRGDYDAKNERMDAYLKVAQDLANESESFQLTRIPRGENVCADALAVLGSNPRDQVKRTIPIQHIDKPSITLSHDECDGYKWLDRST